MRDHKTPENDIKSITPQRITPLSPFITKTYLKHNSKLM